MKKSILKRVFIMNLILILCILVTGMLLSRFFLKTYYLKEKEKELTSIARDISSGKITEDKYEELEARYNIGIRVGSSLLRMPRMHRRMMRETPAMERLKRLENLKPGEITTMEYRPPNLSIDLMSIVTKNNSGELIFVSTPVSSVEESVAIFNRFYLHLGAVSILIGSIISYLFSIKMTRPVNEITRIAKKMTGMDFNEKCHINTQDELQELGESVNQLSHSLENNISKLKIANEKLKEDVEKEKRIDKMRREFIAAASHEIKTPIAIINTYAESLKEGVVDEDEKEEYYDSIVEEGTYISDLVSDLLKLIELEDDTKTVNLESVDLPRAIHYELERFKKLLIEKGIDIQVKLPKKCLVYANKNSLHIILSNLLSNALKYGESSGKIIIEVFIKGSRAIVEIENSGAHIPELELNNLWKPFYKLDSSRSRKYGGSGGMGLAIVSGILKKLGGNYGVSNTESGVKFWFDLLKI